MKPIEFPEVNAIYAKDQPEYIPLPCHKTPSGDVITCFQLSEEELKEISETGKLWISIKTFNNPLQPIFMSTKKEDVCIIM